MEFLTVETHEPDEDLMATLASLGRLAGQFVAHREAEAAVHDTEARKRAMLDAALDAVITIDAGGRIVEVNAAVEDIFGHSPESLIGREMAAALVPRHLRERHRRGLARGRPAQLIGRRIEITALHADGTRVPGRADDHPDRRPRPADVHRLRARHHRPPRSASASSRTRAPASSPPPTRPAAASSATSTTAPRTACWPSRSTSRCSRTALDGRAAPSSSAAVREELELATDELRELARGIHPAVLTELGLVAALRTLVAPRAAARRLRRTTPRTRCPAPVEAAAYFLAAEALTNVVRYADATRADVHVHLTETASTVDHRRRRPRRRRPARRLRPARDGRPPRRARRHARPIDSPPGAGHAS